MENNNSNKMLPRFISFLSFLFLFNPVAPKCVPRNLTATQNPTLPPPQVLSPPIATPPKAVPPPSKVVPSAPQSPPSKGLGAAVGGIVSGVASPVLKTACGQTDYPDICMKTLTPFSSGLQNVAKPDPIALLKISIAAAVAETKTVMQTAEKLMAEKAGSPSFVSSLQDCRDNYNDALENYQSALDAIPENDLGTINSMLSAAVTDYGTCDDGFMGTNPLINQDETLSHMGSNCLAMASLLEQNV